MQSSFIEITLRHGCSPVNLLHIFRTPFPKNTSEELLLYKRFIGLLIKCSASSVFVSTIAPRILPSLLITSSIFFQFFIEIEEFCHYLQVLCHLHELLEYSLFDKYYKVLSIFFWPFSPKVFLIKDCTYLWRWFRLSTMTSIFLQLQCLHISLLCTAKNTVISPDFLVWKLCGNCTFPQNFHTRKSGEITVFFAVIALLSIKWFGDRGSITSSSLI